MDVTKGKMSPDSNGDNKHGFPMIHCPAFNNLLQIPYKLQKCLKSNFKQSLKDEGTANTTNSVSLLEKESYTGWEATLEKQLLNWKNNPYWVDKHPEIKVCVPKGSLCNLNVKFNVGLPPDAIYNIVTDPDNRRVFKNIKEVTSRRVLVDEDLRQVVEVEQAAIWRFLWWSGTISVHVLVDQNRKDHTVKFKQGKSGFMKIFEGCWRVEPLFVDEQLCSPHKPSTWADYDSCTGGKGRVGSVVTLDQLIQPALVPPPPISWYLRGITARTTEMLISDLLAEAARVRGFVGDATSCQEIQECNFGTTNVLLLSAANNSLDGIKERWHQRRRRRRK